jgi:large subunit ribosomal protein L7/L12
MSTVQAKIDAIMAEAKRKADQLRAKEELIQARKLQSIIKKDRASDTRRKILAGSLILELMDKNPDTKARYMANLDKYLTRADDRELFGLPPKDKTVLGVGEASSAAAG